MNFLGLHAALTGFQACNPRNCPTHTEVLGSFIAHLMFTPKGELHIYREIVFHWMSCKSTRSHLMVVLKPQGQFPFAVSIFSLLTAAGV
jgi:hypothetical protein